MKKIILLLVLTLMLAFGTASAETLSLTTYYPSPFGVYNQLRLVPQGADPPCTAGNDGLLWINTNNELRMCNGTLAGPVDVVWSQDTAVPPNVFVTDMASTPTIRVGIGTQTPQNKLHINTPAGTNSLIQYSVAAAGTQWTTGVDTAGSFIVNRSGAATNPLQIGTTDGVTIGVADATNDLTIIGNNNTNAIVWDAGQAALRHHNDTLVTQRPTFNLLLDSDANETAAAFNVFNNLGASAGNATVHFDLDGGNSWVNGGGNFGINTTAPARRLHVNCPGAVPTCTQIAGDLLVSDGANGIVQAHAFFYISDEDMKENVEPISGLDTIMRLEGVQFDWKATGEKGIGLIAQDVEKVLPDLVNTDVTTNKKAVSYGNLVAPLIEAIKEQQKQIEALQKEIEELKNRQF